MGDILFGLAAILLGVAASYGLYWLLDYLVRKLPQRIQDKIRYLGFILPAAVLLIVVLVVPMIETIVWSFMDDGVKKFVGIKNYAVLFSSADFYSTLFNNFLWVAFVPAVTVILGLIFATLGNNVGPTREKIFKSIIFMPMAISFVAASTIWKFTYAFAPPGRPQIGMLNVIWSFFGNDPVPWLTIEAGRLNTFLLMIIIIWLQAGYAMVLLSAGIKAVPEETIEAAKVDGANGFQVFFRVVVPQIRGTIMSVFVTILIMVLKVFDIVLGMTAGNFNTNVLALAFYREFIVAGKLGGASAIVVILCLLIAPLMWLQIRSFRQQESLR